MKILFATSNAAKLTSVARVLGRAGIEVERVDVDLPELQAESAADVARGKARAAFALLKAPVMVIDSAMHVRVLNGFPGTNVKWATRQIGVQGYLDLLARYRAPRACRIDDAIGYFDARLDEPRIFLREEHGSIATEARGDASGHKSAIATLFVPARQHKTLAEMSAQEFEAYRSRPAMEVHYRALAEWLALRSD